MRAIVLALLTASPVMWSPAAAQSTVSFEVSPRSRDAIVRENNFGDRAIVGSALVTAPALSTSAG